jgi:uncharacterized membrane protein
VDPESLNFVDGYAITILNLLVDHVNHEWASTGADAEATRNKAMQTFAWVQVLGLVALVIILAHNILSSQSERIPRRGKMLRKETSGHS